MRQKNPSSQDRDSTEAALEAAALRLLARNGVLAGLNLREVATEAGVNRGLVYHYFGSRTALLRRALRRNARERIAAVSGAIEFPFRKRVLHYWRTMVKYRREVRLAALLLLDSDNAVFDPDSGPKLTPVRKQTIEGFAGDQETGAIDASIDLDGLHAVIVAFMSGYAIYREELAHSAKLSATAMDKKVEATFERMLEGLEDERPKATRSSKKTARRPSAV